MTGGTFHIRLAALFIANIRLAALFKANIRLAGFSQELNIASSLHHSLFMQGGDSPGNRLGAAVSGRALATVGPFPPPPLRQRTIPHPQTLPPACPLPPPLPLSPWQPQGCRGCPGCHVVSSNGSVCSCRASLLRGCLHCQGIAIRVWALPALSRYCNKSVGSACTVKVLQ